MIYLPDTNAVSDLLRLHPQVTAQRDQRLRHGDQTNLCPPVLYEILRSLLKVNATAQIKQFQEQFIPNYGWTPVTDEDWRQTARFWADSSSKGKQLSEYRFTDRRTCPPSERRIVSSDADFDALPVKREDWRTQTSNS